MDLTEPSHILNSKIVLENCVVRGVITGQNMMPSLLKESICNVH